MEYFGFKLKALRLRKHLTQEQLSEKIGVQKATISAYENGTVYPSVTTAIKLCEYFNVSTDYLLGLDKEFNNMKSLSDEQYETITALINQFTALNELIPLDNTNKD